MLSYCLKCRKNVENKKRKVEKIKKGTAMLPSNCEVFGSKNLVFIKEQEASGSLSSLEINNIFNFNSWVLFYFEDIKWMSFYKQEIKSCLKSWMPEDNLDLHIVIVEHSLKTKKE